MPLGQQPILGPGIPGGNIVQPIAHWVYSNNTAIADPTAGFWRANNAVLLNAGILALSVTDNAAVNRSGLLQSTIIAGKSHLLFTDTTSGGNVDFLVISVTNNGTWYLYGISPVSLNGTFNNGDICALAVSTPSAVATQAEILAPVPNVQNSSIMTPADIRNNFLYGIPQTNYLGQTLTDDNIRFHIDAATDWLERELQISIRQRYWQQERHDYVATDYFNFGTIRLNHVPLLKVTQYLVIYPDTGQTTSFPLEWVQTDAEGITGEIQLVPGVGSANAFVIGMGNTLLPMIFKTSDYLPDLFKISYISGFPNNKVPGNILQVIGKKVAIDILLQVSNALLAQGTVGQSLSIDGMSQSTQKLPFIYMGQISMLQKQIDAEISTLRSFYSGLRMTVA